MDSADRPNSSDADSPGVSATPLDDVELARWNAAADAASQFAGAVISGNEEGASAAGAQMRTIPLDLNRVLNAVHVPEDAGGWAEGLERIVRRIPDGWGRWIRVERGWYPIIVALDEQLAEIDPGYVVHQVKEKFGRLDVYFEQSELECCERFRLEHPIPTWNDDAEERAWEVAVEEHDESAEHVAALAEQHARQELMDAAVRRASSLASRTCELTGEPGVMMINRGWHQTLDPTTAPAEAEILEPQPLAKLESPTVEQLAKQVGRLDAEVSHWFLIAERLRRALVDGRGELRYDT
jgi:hypothetical protein